LTPPTCRSANYVLFTAFGVRMIKGSFEKSQPAFSFCTHPGTHTHARRQLGQNVTSPRTDIRPGAATSHSLADGARNVSNFASRFFVAHVKCKSVFTALCSLRVPPPQPPPVDSTCANQVDLNAKCSPFKRIN
jgi:hypothetical protein